MKQLRDGCRFENKIVPSWGPIYLLEVENTLYVPFLNMGIGCTATLIVNSAAVFALTIFAKPSCFCCLLNLKKWILDPDFWSTNGEVKFSNTLHNKTEKTLVTF